MRSAHEIKSFEEFKERMLWMKSRICSDWEYSESTQGQVDDLMGEIEYLVARFLNPEKDWEWKRLKEAYQEGADPKENTPAQIKAAFIQLGASLDKYMDKMLKNIIAG